MGGWGFFMMLIPLLLIGLIIYALYQLGSSKRSDEVSSKTPEDILAERFAKGEISEEEYNRMKATLKK
ncbi:hypothetical protein EAL2_c19390 [Peptoclostridium acidaminophilum DSM 3953]|uniref:SHOCT domain-containing protein n=2 Tax=Peptoclostridium acidaminophilum TaxID=1731 RepID=W8T8N4_PEPAC|nr:hypothetical protein EAL2_c19390 [Peptoclostridium acidaminophilum DSM 3953]